MKPVEQLRTGQPQIVSAPQANLEQVEPPTITCAAWRSNAVPISIRSNHLSSLSIPLIVVLVQIIGIVLDRLYIGSDLARELTTTLSYVLLVPLAAVLFGLRRDPETPLDTGQYRVRIFLSKGGMQYALDNGAISFQDGHLHFEGLNTMFSFSAESATFEPYRSRFIENFTQTIIGHLSFQASGEEYELRINAGQSKEFAEQFSVWQKQRTDSDSEVLPPITPNQAGLTSARFAAREAFGMTAVLLPLWIGVINSCWKLDHATPHGGYFKFQLGLFIFATIFSALYAIFLIWRPFTKARRRIVFIEQGLSR